MNTTTRDPFRQSSRTTNGAPVRGRGMEISSGESGVYVLAGKYIVICLIGVELMTCCKVS